MTSVVIPPSSPDVTDVGGVWTNNANTAVFNCPIYVPTGPLVVEGSALIAGTGQITTADILVANLTNSNLTHATIGDSTTTTGTITNATLPNATIGTSTTTTGTITNATLPNATIGTSTTTTGTITNATLTQQPVVPQALHLWVKTLPPTTLTPNAGTRQPLTPYTTVFQQNGPFTAAFCFNSSGQFTPPVRGIWHFGWWMRVNLPTTAVNISATFQTNATDGTTNMLSTVTIPCTGVAAEQGMNLTGTALLGPSDYVNLYMYYAGSGICTTDNSNGQSNFFATLIQRTV